MVKGTQLGPTLDWRIPMYQQSDDLRFEKYPFRAICGGNIAFHRSVMQYAGWFDEEFTAWEQKIQNGVSEYGIEDSTLSHLSRHVDFIKNHRRKK